MIRRVQILIIDDQLRARKGLRALLSTWLPACEIREAEDGDKALPLIEKQKPDVVLMDVHRPDMDGLQATRPIKAWCPQVKVIVLTLYVEYEAETMAAGADAFVVKSEAADRLLATLSTVTASRRPASNGVS